MFILNIHYLYLICNKQSSFTKKKQQQPKLSNRDFIQLLVIFCTWSWYSTGQLIQHWSTYVAFQIFFFFQNFIIYNKSKHLLAELRDGSNSSIWLLSPSRPVRTWRTQNLLGALQKNMYVSYGMYVCHNHGSKLFLCDADIVIFNIKKTIDSIIYNVR